MKLITALAGMLISLILSAQFNSNQWQSINTSNETLARSENAFVRAGTKFYLIGGRGVKPVAIFNPSDNSWSEGSIPPVEMHHFQAVTFEGLVYVMGGLSGEFPFEIPLSHIYLYDPLSDHWTIGPKIPEDRQRGGAGVTVYKNKIYMVNGIVNGHKSGWVPWFDEYDPHTNSWTKFPDAPRARDHFQTAIINDKLIVTGGRRSGYQGKGLVTIGETNVYDFASGQWSSLPSSGNIPTHRAGCSAFVYGGELIIIGGESYNQVKAHNEVEALDTKTWTWRSLPPLQRGRHGTQAVESNGQLYIAAGCGDRGGSPELNTIEKVVLQGSERKDVAIEAGTLEVDKTTIDFGTLDAYQTKKVTVSLSNKTGNQGAPIAYIAISDSPDFSVRLPYELPYILGAGKSVTFEVSYHPTTSKHSVGRLFVKKSDHGQLKPLEIVLKGGGN